MADTHIKYNDHSINSAFKNHYIVPDYQREYVWKDEQVEQLLADLLLPWMPTIPIVKRLISLALL